MFGLPKEVIFVGQDEMFGSVFVYGNFDLFPRRNQSTNNNNCARDNGLSWVCECVSTCV